MLYYVVQGRTLVSGAYASRQTALSHRSTGERVLV